GIRVTEADIYLGVVASKNPGWVRDQFLPFLNVLSDVGFRLDPNLLFRSLTAVGIKRVRFKDIDDKFWERDQIEPAWKKGREGWDKAGARLGVDGAEILADFRPQWHHIYPQKFLRGKAEPDKIDSLANIAVIGPNINIRISNQDPMKYLDKYSISNDKLEQQV